ncbi:hypothetical protein D9611_009617 [Ephemerocybe angulata]|uniref:DUF6533 domain-containing protein n=1 Tax=Ephemerocybe angulata TaxID=980116 RepID=A0A8H5FG04_9AGAR|nr:hypothetical protein D9611_009617 [Tulosesus angulatus]
MAEPQYIYLSSFAIYVYHYVTTFDDEVAKIWPQMWRAGKVLFMVTRYVPLVYIATTLLDGYRVYTVLPPKACSGLWLGGQIATWIMIWSSEVVLLLCLHALLGARRRYLMMILAVYVGLTIGVHVPRIKWLEQKSYSPPIGPLDEGLGYACTWGNAVTPASRRARTLTNYVNLAKSAWMSALTLGVLYVRFRAQRGSLIKIIRRDSAFYTFSLTAIRLGNAATAASKPMPGAYNVPNAVFTYLQNMVAPIVACQLLLNMQKTSDPGVRSVVSTILFKPSYTMGSEGVDSEQSDDTRAEDGRQEDHAPRIEMVAPASRYSGLGRQDRVRDGGGDAA